MVQEKVKIDITPRKKKGGKSQNPSKIIKNLFKKSEPIDPDKFKTMLDTIKQDVKQQNLDHKINNETNITKKQKKYNEIINSANKQKANTNKKESYNDITKRIALLKSNMEELDSEIRQKDKPKKAMRYASTKAEKLKAEEIQELNEEIDEDLDSLENIKGMKDLFLHLKSMKNYIENHDLKLKAFDSDIKDLNLIKEELEEIKETIRESKDIKAESGIDIPTRIQDIELRLRILDKTLNTMISDVELEMKKNMEDVYNFMEEYKDKLNIINNKLNLLLDNKEKVKIMNKEVNILDSEFHKTLKEIHKTYINDPNKFDLLSKLYEQLCDIYNNITKEEQNKDNLEYYYDKIISWHKKLS